MPEIYTDCRKYMETETNIENILKKRIYKLELSVIVLLSMFVFYTVIFSYITIQRYLAFKTTVFDLAVYTQVLWNTLHGLPFYYTLETHVVPTYNFLSLHFAPFIVIILPLYYLIPDARTLLVLQSMVLAAGIFPLYGFARSLLNNNSLSLLFALLYLVYPPLHGVNWFDFHIEAFTPLLVLSVFYSLEAKKIKLLYLSTILLLMVIEFTPIIAISIFTIMLLVKIKDKFIRKHLAILLIISIIYFFIILQILHSNVSPFRLRMWSQYGGSVEEALHRALQDPEWFLETLLRSVFFPPSKILYVFITFLPAFSAIFSPVVLTTLSWYLPALASNSPPFGIYLDIYLHYPSFLIGQLFASAIYGFSYIYRNSNKKLTIYVVLLQILISLIFFVTLSPLGFASHLIKILGNQYYAEFLAFPSVSQHDVLLEKILNMIPSNASVYTTNDIGSHLGNRRYLFVSSIPEGFMPDFIVFDISRPYWLVSPPIENYPPAYKVINDLLKTGRYGLYIYADGIYVYRLGYSGKPVMYMPQFVRTYTASNGSAYFVGQIVNGNLCLNSSQATHWFIYGRYGLNVTTVVYGPYTVLGPGRYLVIYSLTVIPSGQPIILDVSADVGRKVLNSSLVEGSGNIYTLEIYLDKIINDLEFRVFVSKDTYICLSYIEASFAGYG